MLFGYEWELTKSPAGAWQWTPKGKRPDDRPRRARPGKKHAPMMFTTDIALRMDPAYEKISSASTRTPTSSPMPSRGRGTS
jgi:catalase-peroxidase